MGVMAAMDSTYSTALERLRSALHVYCPFTTVTHGLNWDGEVELKVSVPPSAVTNPETIAEIYRIVRSWRAGNDHEGNWRVVDRAGVTVQEYDE